MDSLDQEEEFVLESKDVLGGTKSHTIPLSAAQRCDLFLASGAKKYDCDAPHLAVKVLCEYVTSPHLELKEIDLSLSTDKLLDAVGEDRVDFLARMSGSLQVEVFRLADVVACADLARLISVGVVILLRVYGIKSLEGYLSDAPTEVYKHTRAMVDKAMLPLDGLEKLFMLLPKRLCHLIMSHAWNGYLGRPRNLHFAFLKEFVSEDRIIYILSLKSVLSRVDALSELENAGFSEKVLTSIVTSALTFKHVAMVEWILTQITSPPAEFYWHLAITDIPIEKAVFIWRAKPCSKLPLYEIVFSDACRTRLSREMFAHAWAQNQGGDFCEVISKMCNSIFRAHNNDQQANAIWVVSHFGPVVQLLSRMKVMVLDKFSLRRFVASLTKRLERAVVEETPPTRGFMDLVDLCRLVVDSWADVKALETLCLKETNLSYMPFLVEILRVWHGLDEGRVLALDLFLFTQESPKTRFGHYEYNYLERSAILHHCSNLATKMAVMSVFARKGWKLEPQSSYAMANLLTVETYKVVVDVFDVNWVQFIIDDRYLLSPGVAALILEHIGETIPLNKVKHTGFSLVDWAIEELPFRASWALFAEFVRSDKDCKVAELEELCRILYADDMDPKLVADFAENPHPGAKYKYVLRTLTRKRKPEELVAKPRKRAKIDHEANDAKLKADAEMREAKKQARREKGKLKRLERRNQKALQHRENLSASRASEEYVQITRKKFKEEAHDRYKSGLKMLVEGIK